MKKALPLILIGAVVLAAGAYFLSQNNQTMPETAEPEQQEQQMSEEQEQTNDQSSITGNLKKILGMGRSLKCSWSSGDASGTTWVKNGMFYNEVSAEGNQARTIFKDDCMWSWQEGKEQGVKMCYSPEEAEEIISGQSEETQENTGMDTDESVPADVNYNCQPATVSDSRFEPPADIQFLDIQQMMQGMQE
jgi:hypothetical protein